MDNLLKELEAKGFYGIIDKLRHGKLSEAEVRGILDGTVEMKTPSVMSPYEAAVTFKARGIGRAESWSRWIQYTGLRPGMDAADWYAIYDAI